MQTAIENSSNSASYPSFLFGYRFFGSYTFLEITFWRSLKFKDGTPRRLACTRVNSDNYGPTLSQVNFLKIEITVSLLYYVSVLYGMREQYSAAVKRASSTEMKSPSAYDMKYPGHLYDVLKEDFECAGHLRQTRQWLHMENNEVLDRGNNEGVQRSHNQTRVQPVAFWEQEESWRVPYQTLRVQFRP